VAGNVKKVTGFLFITSMGGGDAGSSEKKSEGIAIHCKRREKCYIPETKKIRMTKETSGEGADFVCTLHQIEWGKGGKKSLKMG